LSCHPRKRKKRIKKHLLVIAYLSFFDFLLETVDDLGVTDKLTKAVLEVNALQTELGTRNGY
jgi:hypothetical protein